MLASRRLFQAVSSQRRRFATTAVPPSGKAGAETGAKKRTTTDAGVPIAGTAAQGPGKQRTVSQNVTKTYQRAINSPHLEGLCEYTVAVKPDCGKPVPWADYFCYTLGGLALWACIETKMELYSYYNKYGKYYTEGWPFFHYDKHQQLREPIPNCPI